jgi:hypothetical protein
MKVREVEIRKWSRSLLAWDAIQRMLVLPTVWDDLLFPSSRAILVGLCDL